jgi:hypothetical protein
MKNRISNLLVVIVVLSLGCIKPQPTDQAQEYISSGVPFARDAPPEALGPGCLTDTLNGCDKARMMEQGVADMWKLHRSQMAQMELSLRSLEGVLRRADSIPTARVSAPKLNANGWNDPDGKYPAPLQVRVEYQRGLDRMGANTVRDMEGALAALQDLDKSQKRAWRASIRSVPSGLVLPKELLMERQYSVVNAKLNHASYSFEVPIHLGQKYIKRSVEPWIAVASHVITKPGVRYKAVAEHRKQLNPAILVSGSGPFSIKELPPLRQKFEFSSKVKPSDACKELRGELRFVRSDETLPLRVAFKAKPASGGAR